MKKMAWILALGAIGGLLPLPPGAAMAALEADELQVALAPGNGDRFLKVVDLVMGTETLKPLGKDKYLVRQGPSGDRDDYAAFFSALPYVADVQPRPSRRPSERSPKGKIHLGMPQRAFVPGEILIKFKRGTTEEQIKAFNDAHGATIKSTLVLGEDKIFRLGLPEGVEVPDMASVYAASDLVEYAEPNFTMGIPKMPPGVPFPPNVPTQPKPQRGLNPLPSMSIDTEQLLGDSVFVRFRPGVRQPVPDLVALVYGVRQLEGDDDRARFSLPKGTNTLTAVRLFKLCPYVLAAEPSYGR